MEKVVKLKPIIKSYIWGGTFFKQYRDSEEEIISESWELSIQKDNVVRVDGFDLPLDKLIKEKDLGPNSKRFPYFPLLIKLIDAKENLSIQVHPSDEYALKNENSYGKCEMWHIIDSEPGSGIYIGLNRDCSRNELKQALDNSTIENYLNFVVVKPGDTFLINPGTIHAIGKGVRLIEIQQNSNLTYRLYDYQRRDKNGNLRELHIDKALQVIDYHRYNLVKDNDETLADNKYFKVVKKTFNRELTISADEGSFLSFTFIDGEGKVDDIKYKKFDTFFLPNGKSCSIKGTGTLIISSVNK